jgi:hypothetical protein
MIPLPYGWAVEPGVDMFNLVPPEGRGAGLFRYKERIRPLHRLGGIVREQLRAMPLFQKKAMSAPLRLTTREGEHAAFVELTGEESGRPAWRFFGVVFGDDFYSLLSGLCLRSDRADKYRELARSLTLDDSLGLGWRRRCYEYTPPAGWQPLTNGFVTEWIPADFPKNSAVITAWPANPRQLASPQIFALEVEEITKSGGIIAEYPEPQPFETKSGLRGKLFALVADHPGKPRRLFKRFIVVEDTRYSYAIGMSVYDRDQIGPHGDAFLEVARSITPIPAPTDERTGRGVVWTWTD